MRVLWRTTYEPGCEQLEAGDAGRSADQPNTESIEGLRRRVGCRGPVGARQREPDTSGHAAEGFERRRNTAGEHPAGVFGRGLLVRQHAVAPGADCSAGAALSGARLEFTGEGFAAGARGEARGGGGDCLGNGFGGDAVGCGDRRTPTVPSASRGRCLIGLRAAISLPRLYVPLAVGPSPGGGLVAAATAMPLVAYTVGVPCAASDTASTSLDSAVRVAVLANDTGPLQAATVMVDPVAGGNFNVDASDGSVTFTPDAGFYGTVSTSYRVADSHGLIVGADLTVTVDAGCTITGTAGVVEITGTDGDDVICVPDILRRHRVPRHRREGRQRHDPGRRRHRLDTHRRRRRQGVCPRRRRHGPHRRRLRHRLWRAPGSTPSTP